jgi:hypothetical protein
LHIQGFALGQTVDDIHQDHIRVAAFDYPLGQGGAHVTRTDHRYLLAHDGCVPLLLDFVMPPRGMIPRGAVSFRWMLSYFTPA